MSGHARVALVTGAAQGIGAVVARTLAARGVAVAALDRNAEGLSQLGAEAAPGRIETFATDVTDRASVELTVKATEAALGPITDLVNAAGVLATGPALQQDDGGWERCMAVNAAGVRNVSLAVARGMAERRRGAIVTIASNAAQTPRAGMASYCASKAAAVAFTKVLGLELATRGIRCNVVSPGSTDTPMQRALWRNGHGAAATIAGTPSAYKVGIPLGRIATPEDIAGAVVFLLSDAARHITMHELCIDGGATLGR